MKSAKNKEASTRPAHKNKLQQRPQRQNSAGQTLSVIPICLGILIGACFLLTLAIGLEYYCLPIHKRPLHDYHNHFRPSGSIGLSLGIGGTLLMIANLSYLVRKNYQRLAKFGNLRSWMAFHVLTGLVGPAAILLHSGLFPQSSLGILGFSAMWVVVLTGVMGRYIYAWVPRSPRGRELEREELLEMLKLRQQQLQNLGVELPQFITSVAREAAPTSNLASAIWMVIMGDRNTRLEYSRMRKSILNNPDLRLHSATLLPQLKRLCREQQWLTRYQEARSLMSSWRFLHRWLVIQLFIILFFHILIAVFFGNLWIWRTS